MEIAGKVVVITGGGSGIGRALALRAHQEGASFVAVADLNEAAARETADRLMAKLVPLSLTLASPLWRTQGKRGRAGSYRVAKGHIQAMSPHDNGRIPGQ